MGGTLEVRKVDDSIVDLEKPVFYDDEGLSDEQIKACREYDKRLQVKLLRQDLHYKPECIDTGNFLAVMQTFLPSDTLKSNSQT